MSDSFNLTSTRGVKDALEKYGGPILLGPYYYLFKGAKSLLDKYLDSPSTIEQQRDTAVAIIKAGKDQGVDSMKITVDQMAGIDLGSELNGVPLKFSVGKNGQMTIEVTYKESRS